MAQFKNISGETRSVPGFGNVAANAVITVDDGLAEGYACETSTWQPMDTAANNAVTALSNAFVVGPPFIRASTR